MYRLLIADDEALEREGIEWIVTRMLPDTFEIIHAENGRTAIQKAEQYHPHIVMMDVRMPGIQGLEALREMKTRNPRMKMILVTAYETFEYAKEALSLGVKEYLVKPAKREQIVALLQRLIAEIEEEQDKRAEELGLRDKLFQLLPLAETEIALDLMSEQIKEMEVEQIADLLGLPLNKGCSIVLAVPESTEKKQLYMVIKTFVQDTIKGRCDYVMSSMVHNHMVIFFLGSLNRDDRMIREEAVHTGAKLREELLSQLNIAISIGIGSVQVGIEGIRRSYYEAVFASTYENKWGSMHQFEDLHAAAGHDPNKRVEALSPNDASMKNAYVQLAIQQIREEREKRTSNMLDKAITYIVERYQDDVSLEDVAEHVHLNPYYFSKVFKQQTGETFIDYVTRLRLEKAKVLMENLELSLKEVCYQVGYNDPNYFSRVFKKVTGMTPTEYRAQLP